MDLATVHTASFKEVIKSKLNTQKEPFPILKTSTNNKFQKVMLPILMIEMGCWRIEIGEKIQSIL
jgi:hypothetical protein